MERYAFDRLGDEEAEAFEEHLLACPACQNALSSLDEYIALMKHVAAQPQVTARSRARFWWAGVAAAAASVAFGIFLNRPNLAAVDAPTVRLAAMRGDNVASVRAGVAFVLAIPLNDLPGASMYRVEIVNANGAAVWTGQALADRDAVNIPVARRLRAGVYWVRLYSSPGGLLREFGLRVE
jgi:hypothetical protein